MEKYKICPLCDEKNAADALECVGCELDLSEVEVTVVGDEQETADQVTPPAQPEAEPTVDETPSDSEEPQKAKEDTGHVLSDLESLLSVAQNTSDEDNDFDHTPTPAPASAPTPAPAPAPAPTPAPKAVPAPAPKPEPAKPKPRELEPVAVSYSDADKNEDTTAFAVICNCSHANPIGTKYCIRCGEFIGNIPPQRLMTDPQSAVAARSITVVAELEGCAVCIKLVDAPKKNAVVIGREHVFKNYLDPKKYVSRKHIRLFIKDSQLYLEDMYSRNGTFVNGAKVRPGTTVRIKDGARIVLGSSETAGIPKNAAVIKIRII